MLSRICRICLLLALIPLASHAQPEDDDIEVVTEENIQLEEGQSLPRSERSEQIHQRINEILANDDFARIEKKKGWRLKRSKEERQTSEGLPGWLTGTLATLFEITIWFFVIGGIGYAFYYYRNNIRDLLRGSKSAVREPLPSNLFGLDVNISSLPKDVAAAAKSLWEDNQRRQALALLLRASLVKLLHDYEVSLDDSDTEAECVERIDQQAPDSIRAFMHGLVRQWQFLAYAHMEPSDQQFDHLCQQWREVF